MKNFLVAKILREIGEMLEIQGVPFKPRAYYKAARTIESLPEPVENVKDLESLPGIGENISKKIREIIRTGSLRYYEKLKKTMPFNFDELMSVEGMGPKKIRKLYDALGIKTLKDLKKAAEKGLIRNIEGFGEKSEQKILDAINLLSKTTGRILLSNALLIAEDLIRKLSPYAKKITYAGSLRRMKETIGDLDLLAVPRSSRLVSEFLKEGSVIVKGPKKCSIHLPSGFQVDLRIIKEEEWGSALQYFTGSKAHNIAVRKIAIKKGYKLNEYGLFKGEKRVAGITEKEIYDKLGLVMVPPEMRENRGEISLKKVPDLVEKVYGDLQMHTNWSDGANSPEEMIEKAISLGYEYVGITDHAGDLPIANAMNESRLRKQIKLFDKLKKKYPIRILHGAEVNIREDGSLDVPDILLKKLDYVLVGIHSKFKMDEEKMTERLVKAVSNDYVKVLGHPACRLIGQREGISADFEKVFEECREHGVIVEVNSQPQRLDLNDVHVMQAIKSGCTLIINTDSHSKEQLNYMRLGIATARRGWAEKKDVINSLHGTRFIRRFLRNSASTT